MLLGHGDDSCATLTCSSLAASGPQRVALGQRGVERLRGDELPVEQLLLTLVLLLGLLDLRLDLGHLARAAAAGPRRRQRRLPSQISAAGVVPLGLLELGADLGDLGAGGRQLGLGERELRLRLGVVEPGQHRALLDPHALLDQHLGHLAGDLGRHGGLAPGGDVAAGVQHRAAVRRLGGRARHRGCAPGRAGARPGRSQSRRRRGQQHRGDQQDRGRARGAGRAPRGRCAAA